MYPVPIGSGLGEIRGLIFFVPEVPQERWELTFSEFDCGSQIDVDRSKRRCIFVGWRPAIIGLKVFFVPCAERLASPIFHRWMTLSIYRWIALPKALGFSNACTASSFTAPRAMSRWNPNEPRMVKKLRLLKGGSVPTFLVLGRCCTTSLPWTLRRDDGGRKQFWIPQVSATISVLHGSA